MALNSKCGQDLRHDDCLAVVGREMNDASHIVPADASPPVAWPRPAELGPLGSSRLTY